jgi:xylan 1,4-beta-xylosidase
MEICFDTRTKTAPTDRTWQFCVGSDHAFQVHRADFQQQMAFVRQELGFQYIRFHGILDDDMNVIQTLSEIFPIPGGEVIQTTNFFQVGRVYDAVLKAGMKPFVELGFMPSALASGKDSVFHYKGNITPPQNLEAWSAFIQQFVRFLLDRYGEEEVESWYFEVWNEPDLGFFWTGGQQGYFELYKATALAIKAVNPRLRVGGPATSANRWLKEFKAYCEAENLPLDFLSTHHYPGDALGHGFDSDRIAKMMEMVRNSKGETVEAVTRKLFYQPEILPLIPKGILTEQLRTARQEVGDLPLMYTEWNCSSTWGAPIHDTKISAAFALKTVLDSHGLADAYAFWCFSDLFEELIFMGQPFNGGFGLLTVDGIPKPNFWAFKLLSQLGDERYDFHFEQDGVEAAAFKKGSQLQILLYHQNFVEEEAEKQPIRLMLPGITRAASVTVQKIDELHCNPKRIWEEMGSPAPLKPDEVETIKAISCLQEITIPFDLVDDTLTIQTEIGVNDIQLITVHR